MTSVFFRYSRNRSSESRTLTGCSRWLVAASQSTGTSPSTGSAEWLDTVVGPADKPADRLFVSFEI